jgi:hypothetical protein
MNKFIYGIVVVVMIVPTIALARGGGSGGGRSFSTSRVSAPRVTAPKVVTPKVSTVKSTQSKVGTSVVNGTKKTGYTVSPTYQPKLSGGYTPPMGSVVYHRQSSFLDYLPLYYILSHDSHQTVSVKEPNSTTTKEVKEEGIDNMYVFNWILTIIFGGLFIWFIMWLINKLTSKK